MNKYKDLALKLLHPNIFLFILIFIIGFGSVICIFLFNMSTHWIAYITYVLSAYALTVTVVRMIKLIKWINKKLHSNKYTNRLITDRALKDNINLFSGTFFNMVFGIFKFVIGIIYTSIWSIAIGVYYLILGVMKLSLTRHVVSKSNEHRQIIQYRNTGILMFLLNVAMVGMIILMVKKGESVLYPGFIIYAQAAYTFYILTIAIINIIKYRKNHIPLIAASKTINLVAAIMALFILQVAMINEFGEAGYFKNIINTITGTITSISTISIAIYMLINSRKIKK